MEFVTDRHTHAWVMRVSQFVYNSSTWQIVSSERVMVGAMWVNCSINYATSNSQISHFGKICNKLALFRKYLVMYHFFSTRVSQNRVLNSTQVQWTWVPKESPVWHCWPGICAIKKNNVVLEFTKLEFHATQYSSISARVLCK